MGGMSSTSSAIANFVPRIRITWVPLDALRHVNTFFRCSFAFVLNEKGFDSLVLFNFCNCRGEASAFKKWHVSFVCDGPLKLKGFRYGQIKNAVVCPRCLKFASPITTTIYFVANLR